MKTKTRKTAQIGELVAAVFDTASQYGTNPEEVSRLATKAVMHILQHARKASISLPSQAECREAGGVC